VKRAAFEEPESGIKMTNPIYKVKARDCWIGEKSRRSALMEIHRKESTGEGGEYLQRQKTQKKKKKKRADQLNFLGQHGKGRQGVGLHGFKRWGGNAVEEKKPSSWREGKGGSGQQTRKG